MGKFQYKDGYLFCRQCKTHYKQELCEYYQSKVQRYQVCPVCPEKYKMRRNAHNKNSNKYYVEVIKPKLQKEREIIVKWKQNRQPHKK